MPSQPPYAITTGYAVSLLNLATIGKALEQPLGCPVSNAEDLCDLSDGRRETVLSYI
jgi:hypothetical protein